MLYCCDFQSPESHSVLLLCRSHVDWIPCKSILNARWVLEDTNQCLQNHSICERDGSESLVICLAQFSQAVRKQAQRGELPASQWHRTFGQGLASRSPDFRFTAPSMTPAFSLNYLCQSTDYFPCSRIRLLCSLFSSSLSKLWLVLCVLGGAKVDSHCSVYTAWDWKQGLQSNGIPLVLPGPPRFFSNCPWRLSAMVCSGHLKWNPSLHHDSCHFPRVVMLQMMIRSPDAFPQRDGCCPGCQPRADVASSWAKDDGTETDSTNGLNPARTQMGTWTHMLALEPSQNPIGTRTQPKARLGLKPMVLN